MRECEPVDAAIPAALLQADAIGADCLSLYGSRLTALASAAGTDLASLTSHVGNGFGQTACDLISPQLLSQWYVITRFGMDPGDASLIDNVAMTSGVNQTGGSDCQYAWEPGYQIGGQISINFYEGQSPASVLQNISDIGPAKSDLDIVAPGALYARSVGQSPPFTRSGLPRGQHQHRGCLHRASGKAGLVRDRTGPAQADRLPLPERPGGRDHHAALTARGRKTPQNAGGLCWNAVVSTVRHSSGGHLPATAGDHVINRSIPGRLDTGGGLGRAGTARPISPGPAGASNPRSLHGGTDDLRRTRGMRPDECTWVKSSRVHS